MAGDPLVAVVQFHAIVNAHPGFANHLRSKAVTTKVQ